MSAAVSRAQRVRQVESMLRALLRTPKTRSGLVAAAVSRGVSKNFVYGWLASHRTDGTVAELKSMRTTMYQMADQAVFEVPVEGQYPSWLEPRVLPMSGARRVFIDGTPIFEKK